MDDRPAQLSEKDIPPPLRPPLITPSLSPPGSRISQRIPDRPAPPKRPRLSATPARSASACLPSSRPQDLRLDSSSRLFAFWDQLADRYNVPLEEDDIVDIRELKLIRDRGVTRSAVKAYDIGSLATSDADDNSSQYADEDDENSAGEDTTPADDESADELDLISEPPVQAVVQEKLEYYKNWYVPPPDEQDPEDAEAFREFEEAERRRRELYGNEEEEEIPTGSADTGVGGTAEEDRDDEDGREDEDEHLERPVAEDEDEEEEEEEAKERLPPSDATPQRRISRPPPQPPEDDSSEDELAAWVIDDTPIPRRSAPPPAFDDIIDLTISRSPSPRSPKRGRSQSRPRFQSRAPSRARSQPARPREVVRPPRRIASPPQVLQLLTPPRSSCSAPDVAPDIFAMPVRRETPSPQMPRPRKRFVPRPLSPTDPEPVDVPGGVELPAAAANRPSSPSPPPRKTPKSVSRASVKPEVVILVPPAKRGRTKTPARSGSPDIPLSVRAKTARQSPQEQGSSKSAKSKGKERAVESTLPEVASAPHTPDRSGSKDRGASSKAISPKPVVSRGRKRRRVPSSSSSDALREPVSQPSSVRKPPRPASRPPTHSSDPVPPTSSPIQSDSEDGPWDAHPYHNHQRARSDAPIPSHPLYPPTYPPFVPRHHQEFGSSASSSSAYQHHALNAPFTPSALQQSQFMAWMSYCMAGGAFPPPAYFPPPLPPQPVPRTPSRRGYPARQSRSFDTPSSEAGPSRSSTFSSPMHHPHPYPQWFHPAYSSGTLPPSSPIPSSPADSSPVLRPASVPPGQRSQARGRRVSFKLDANDRPLSATPPRHASSRDSIDEDRGFDEEDTRPRGRGGRSATPATVPRNKGKGKARAVFSSDEAEAEEDGEEDDGSQRSPPPRARTPGPPSRREQSVPRGASSSRGKASAKKK